MRVSLKINEEWVVIDVKSVEVDIDSCQASIEESQILLMSVMFAKIRFLEKYDKTLTLEQLSYMADKLPDTLFWESNYCIQCDSEIPFKDEDIPNWLFDEMKGVWICPGCRKKPAEVSKITETVKEASEKAKQIEGRQEYCEACGVAYDIDGRCECGDGGPVSDEEVELMPADKKAVK